MIPNTQQLGIVKLNTKGIYKRTEEIRQKMKLSHLGKHMSEESKKKNRLAHLGKTFTEEHKEKIRLAQSGENNPMYGRYHTEKTKEKMSLSRKGKPSTFRGKHHSKETIEKMRLAQLGKHLSEKTKKGIRLARLKIIEKTIFEGGQVSPAYNLNACKFFVKFDQLNNTNGMYATNGGEYHIKELGYFPDYFNPNLKLIMEWDEKHHYRNNQLKEKDIKRQKEIQSLFPDYKFVRIKEKDLIGVSE